jgi:hypothetical protein
MYISAGHFLAPHLAATQDGEPCNRLVAVDTELMVGVRLTGYHPDNGSEIIDLIKVDKVFLINVPPGLMDLVPDGIEVVEIIKEDGE